MDCDGLCPVGGFTPRHDKAEPLRLPLAGFGGALVEGLPYDPVPPEAWKVREPFVLDLARTALQSGLLRGLPTPGVGTSPRTLLRY
jgi:hypothetical protein